VKEAAGITSGLSAIMASCVALPNRRPSLVWFRQARPLGLNRVCRIKERGQGGEVTLAAFHLFTSRCSALSEAPFGGHIARSGAIRLLLGTATYQFEFMVLKFVTSFDRFCSISGHVCAPLYLCRRYRSRQ
jgi:hypothetical protein